MSVGPENVGVKKKKTRRHEGSVARLLRLRNSTLTDITDRLINNFFKMSCETAVSLQIGCGPMRSFDSTVLPMDEDDVDEKYGHEIKETLFAAQKAKQNRLRDVYKKIEDEQRRVKKNIPHPVTLPTSSSKSSTTKTSEKRQQHSKEENYKNHSEMSAFLWSMGSSNSI